MEDFLQDSEGCDTLTMQEALENSILLQYRNQSLENLTAEDLQHYGLGNSKLTSVITNNMQMVNFSGATGQIHFNEFHESDTEVHILQIQSGEAVHIGSYNPMSQNLTLHLQPSETIPEDDFEIIRLKLDQALPIVTLVAVGLMLVLTTIILILFLHHWNKPAIKATSPYLSLLIFAGCYLLYGAVIILALREYMDNFGELCQSEFWFDIIGTLLIYRTLFVRLLRVYRIFFHVFQKPGKFLDRLVSFHHGSSYRRHRCYHTSPLVYTGSIADNQVGTLHANFCATMHFMVLYHSVIATIFLFGQLPSITYILELLCSL